MEFDRFSAALFRFPRRFSNILFQARYGECQYYRNAFAIYARMHMQSPMNFDDDDPRKTQAGPVAVSAAYQAQNIHKAPFLVIPCIEGRVEESASVFPQASMYGSILPATWSLMLALRARGLGTAWTALHLMEENMDFRGKGDPGGDKNQCRHDICRCVAVVQDTTASASSISRYLGAPSKQFYFLCLLPIEAKPTGLLWVEANRSLCA